MDTSSTAVMLDISNSTSMDLVNMQQVFLQADSQCTEVKSLMINAVLTRMFKHTALEVANTKRILGKSAADDNELARSAAIRKSVGGIGGFCPHDATFAAWPLAKVRFQYMPLSGASADSMPAFFAEHSSQDLTNAI